MTAPTSGWFIDCGHWHCPERDARHAHDIAPSVCPECAEERPESDMARRLRERAEQIANKRSSK